MTQEDGAMIEEKDLLDTSKAIVPVKGGSIDERVLREIPHKSLDGNYIAVRDGMIQEMRETTGKVLSRVIGVKKLLCAAKEDILASAFDTDAGIAVHLVNITDVLAKNGETVAHYDPIKPYCENAVPCGDVTLSLSTAREIRGAMAYTPEKPEGIPLDLQRSNGRVSMTVPAGFFAGYCLIELITGQ
jgi:hypothetical protein